jgi:KUP system potassium uptake protein
LSDSLPPPSAQPASLPPPPPNDASVPPPRPSARSLTEGHAPAIRNRKDLAKFALAALGVVYGDIGTSPLYAAKECFMPPHGVAVTEGNVFGILSLIFWSLFLVIVVKYITYILRADNHGEGGILALLALVNPRAPKVGESVPPSALQVSKHKRTVLMMLGLFGAALLYGDGVITPAISVLGAVEGLSVATSTFNDFVVPITVTIIVALFIVQKRGTARVGAIFGPATLLWFITIAAMGIPWILKEPRVLTAVNPLHAVRFFMHNGTHAFLVLGSVVLCITGGEALYADMGHFGKAPIRFAWYAVVSPALFLNYFGQGALFLTHARNHTPVTHPFYEMVSGWVLYPVIVIATIAAIVASQALISGAYSLTQQAVQLGYCPRMSIVHTSGEAEGQIYVPEINNALMVACVSLVLMFKSSTALAAAYGIAVTGTMAITSILFYFVARQRLGFSAVWAGVLVTLFLVIDIAFFSANVVKIADGGWFPIVVAAVVFTLMTTWKRGRAELAEFLTNASLPIDVFLEDLERVKPHRVKGTAVFMASNLDGAPPVLLHHFKHNKVLHEQIIMLSVVTVHRPEVPVIDRLTIRRLQPGFYLVVAKYGFMQSPNALEILALCKERGMDVDQNDTSFFLGRETLLTTGKSSMAPWRKALFAIMSRNARPATAFFGLPPNRVVEMGTQIEL